MKVNNPAENYDSGNMGERPKLITKTKLGKKTVLNSNGNKNTVIRGPYDRNNKSQPESEVTINKEIEIKKNEKTSLNKKEKDNLAEFLLKTIMKAFFLSAWKKKVKSMKYYSRRYIPQRANFKKFINQISSVIKQHKNDFFSQIYENMKKLPLPDNIEHDYNFGKLRIINKEFSDKNNPNKNLFWKKGNYNKNVTGFKSLLNQAIKKVNEKKPTQESINTNQDKRKEKTYKDNLNYNKENEIINTNVDKNSKNTNVLRPKIDNVKKYMREYMDNYYYDQNNNEIINEGQNQGVVGQYQYEQTNEINIPGNDIEQQAYSGNDYYDDNNMVIYDDNDYPDDNYNDNYVVDPNYDNNYEVIGNNANDANNYNVNDDNNYIEDDANNYIEDDANNYIEGDANNYIEGDANNYIEGDVNNYYENDVNNYIENDENNYVENNANNYVENDANNYIENDVNNYIEKDDNNYAENGFNNYGEENYIRNNENNYIVENGNNNYIIENDANNYIQNNDNNYIEEDDKYYIENNGNQYIENDNNLNYYDENDYYNDNNYYEEQNEKINSYDNNNRYNLFDTYSNSYYEKSNKQPKQYDYGNNRKSKIISNYYTKHSNSAYNIYGNDYIDQNQNQYENKYYYYEKPNQQVKVETKKITYYVPSSTQSQNKVSKIAYKKYIYSNDYNYNQPKVQKITIDHTRNRSYDNNYSRLKSKYQYYETNLNKNKNDSSSYSIYKRAFPRKYNNHSFYISKN